MCIQQIEVPSEVIVHLKDGRVLKGPRNTRIEVFLKALPEWDNSFIVGAVVNGELRELTYPIEMESYVRPITMRESDGALIYRRSVTFLLEAAFEELFPKAGLSVDHSVVSGGYFCRVIDCDPLDDKDLNKLETHMNNLVHDNLPFERIKVPLEEAVDYFKTKGLDDKVRLLKYRQKEYLVLYQLGNHKDYHHGYMVPSTGYLKWFAFRKLNDGFVLRFPHRQSPDMLQHWDGSRQLLATFAQYRSWLTKLNIENVGDLNDAIHYGKIHEIILVSEALHEQKIAEIGTEIVDSKRRTRIVLIAGPSSSGKTTFSKRLSIQLLAHGISPFPLELDNYFVDRDRTPLDKNGDFDFEVINALDTDRLNSDLKRLIVGEEIQLPRYDFKSGKSIPGDVVRLTKDQFIILEGIHGLNPKLTPTIAQNKTFRIYISCLTQLNLDRYNRISTTDTRLIRRIVRDARERGYTAQQTIQRWESVQHGEKRHIFPFQDNADEMFNSALVYELAALKPLAEPILRQVPYGTPEYVEAKRLVVFMDWFLPLNHDLIPDNSIVREFIGGSILKDFKLWEKSNLD